MIVCYPGRVVNGKLKRPSVIHLDSMAGGPAGCWLLHCLLDGRAHMQLWPSKRGEQVLFGFLHHQSAYRLAAGQCEQSLQTGLPSNRYLVLQGQSSLSYWGDCHILKKSVPVLTAMTCLLLLFRWLPPLR